MRIIKLPKERYRVKYEIVNCEHCGGPTLKKNVFIEWPCLVGFCRDCGSPDVQETLGSEPVCECNGNIRIVGYKR
jgi:hypothetical protein